MFIEFLKSNDFFENYMDVFATRFTVGNLEMEDSKTDVIDSKRVIELYNNKTAFMTLLKANPDKLSPYDVIDVADNVNKNIGFYSKGYRKTQVKVAKAKKFFPIPAKEVPSKMYSLFDTYYNIWCDLPVYEREARFHIELVRLQPFEDGNKRTARILTCYNLCKQNKAPIIIPGSETEEYFNYIDNYDVEGMTKLFERKSIEELEVMINLYRRICGDEFESEETEENRSIMSFIITSENNNSLSSSYLPTTLSLKK